MKKKTKRRDTKYEQQFGMGNEKESERNIYHLLFALFLLGAISA